MYEAQKKWRKAHYDRYIVAHRKWQEKNKEKVRAYARKWQHEHKEQASENKKIWRSKNREKLRQWARDFYKTGDQKLKNKIRKLRNKYKITLSQEEQLKGKNNYKCWICNHEGPLVIDHDHETGRVRGILCQSCNIRIAYFERLKSEEIINMQFYLQQAKELNLYDLR